MRRLPSTPRNNWQGIVKDQGLVYHSPEGNRYWDESVRYEFTLSEVERIERATEELYSMYLAAAQHIIDQKRYSELGIPAGAVANIERTWEEEPPSLYGRFDLAYDGQTAPKLLEFNADTPTALLEAAVIQWYWLQDLFKTNDQFNSLHEKLVAKWKDIKPSLAGDVVYFCHMDDWEDWMTVCYLRETAAEAGLNTGALLMEELGYNSTDFSLRDLDDQPIATLFKLYPWEWMYDEVRQTSAMLLMKVQWIEPIWKMLWSNKGMLAILWELYPNHELLLPAFLDGPRELERYVVKPLLSREGANLEVIEGGKSLIETPGPYASAAKVYQGLAPIPCLDGNYPVLGSWYVMDQGPAGMGIRESSTLVTDNFSRFVPHLIRG